MTLLEDIVLSFLTNSQYNVKDYIKMLYELSPRPFSLEVLATHKAYIFFKSNKKLNTQDILNYGKDNSGRLYSLGEKNEESQVKNYCDIDKNKSKRICDCYNSTKLALDQINAIREEDRQKQEAIDAENLAVTDKYNKELSHVKESCIAERAMLDSYRVKTGCAALGSLNECKDGSVYPYTQPVGTEYCYAGIREICKLPISYLDSAEKKCITKHKPTPPVSP